MAIDEKIKQQIKELEDQDSELESKLHALRTQLRAFYTQKLLASGYLEGLIWEVDLQRTRSYSFKEAHLFCRRDYAPEALLDLMDHLDKYVNLGEKLVFSASGYEDEPLRLYGPLEAVTTFCNNYHIRVDMAYVGEEHNLLTEKLSAVDAFLLAWK